MKHRIRDVDKPAYFLYWYKNYNEDPSYTLDYITIPIFNDDESQVIGFSPYIDNIDEILYLDELCLDEMKNLEYYNDLYKKCMIEDSTGFEFFNEDKFMEWLRNHHKETKSINSDSETKNNEYQINLDVVFGGKK